MFCNDGLYPRTTGRPRFARFFSSNRNTLSWVCDRTQCILWNWRYTIRKEEALLVTLLSKLKKEVSSYICIRYKSKKIDFCSNGFWFKNKEKTVAQVLVIQLILLILICYNKPNRRILQRRVQRDHKCFRFSLTETQEAARRSQLFLH